MAFKSIESDPIDERLSYDAWGKRRQPTGLDAAAPITPATTHHGYTGHEHLDGLGLIHMNARVYDPNIGRFTSADPIGFEGGLDVYGYASGNPINYTDPSGLDTKVSIGYTNTPVPGTNHQLVILTDTITGQQFATRKSMGSDSIDCRPH